MIEESTSLQEQETIRSIVRQGYGAVAEAEETTSCGPTCCGGQVSNAEALAHSVGYSQQELEQLPQGANMGLSCGNPTALAALRAGETVLDLGSGGGFDVFIAGKKVGPTGHVIGVDMTPQMLAKARKNQLAYTERTGLNNVEFRLGEIEHLPVANGTVDVVISNCVINLSPQKKQVYSEIARVLVPGGRIAISDIVLKRPLPKEIRSDAEALVGCVAGALLISQLEAILHNAGLVDIDMEEKPGYIQAMEESKDHIAKRVMQLLPPGETMSDYIASMNITARKPAARGCCG
ncbi:MAG: arsenite methyltransferase [Candidatus Sumerlaeia bacterium]|nr:arsenite methyltransferase [Candidatus Sumerlaeia bacterium]